MIGKKIRLLREILGMTQEDFAQSIGITQQVLSKCENGNREIEFDLIDRIVQKYNTPFSFFSNTTTIDSEKIVETTLPEEKNLFFSNVNTFLQSLNSLQKNLREIESQVKCQKVTFENQGPCYTRMLKG